MNEAAAAGRGKVLSATTDHDWVTFAPSGELGADDETGSEELKTLRRALDQLLIDVLLAENLVIVAGLGTTLCLNKPGTEPIAPGMSDLWEESAKSSGFDQIRERVKYVTPSTGDNIETLLSQCQLSQSLDPDPDVATFIAETEAMIVQRCRFVTDKTDLSVHESFLRKVARRSTRQPRTKLFTTNYDMCFETAASHTRFLLVDGFSHTQPQEFDGSYFAYDLVRRGEEREVSDYVPNVFHLYKIHGSVDWETRGGEVIKGVLPEKPLLIYPRHSKFEASYDQPFIEMMSRFQSALRQANTGLLVIGFGFNDPHIWQPIMSAIRSNVSLKALVVDPDLEASTKAPIMQIAHLIRAGDSRLTLMAAGFEDLVAILPDLVAVTEEERHRGRVRGLGDRK